MFWKKKRLYDMNPRDLDFQTLLRLHIGLLAKTLIATEELRDRLAALASLNDALEPQLREATDFEGEAKRMNSIYLILENVLAQQTGKAPRG